MQKKEEMEEENGTLTRLEGIQHHNMGQEHGRVLRDVILEAAVAIMVLCLPRWVEKASSHASRRSIVHLQ